MARIYTKTGDAGLTGLFDGSRVPKHEPRVAACGDVDELNASLGVACSLLATETCADLLEELQRIQRDLLAVGALLADPRRDAEPEPDAAAPADGRLDVGRIQIERLERAIDRWEAELEPLRQFILPGGCQAAAALHASRTVGRRAERSVVALAPSVQVAPRVVVFLNRLSDLLFVAARLANRREGRADIPW